MYIISNVFQSVSQSVGQSVSQSVSQSIIQSTPHINGSWTIVIVHASYQAIITITCNKHLYLKLRVVVSTAAFYARARGWFSGRGGFKETKMFLSHPLVLWGVSVTEK